MSALGSPDSLLLSSSGGYEIERSLRFNRSDTAELNFTPSSAGNQKTWTWSAWIKRSSLNTSGNYQYLFNPQRGGDGSNEAVMRFRDDNTLEIYDSGATRGQLITSQVFRDVSAWYHIVFVLDTTQATAANRAKLYVNGEQVTSFSTETYPSQNTTWGWNGAQEHGLGVYNLYDAQYFDGYMAEVNFVDGTALDETDFGETDTETGAWIPKKYSGSYGTNGFYLKFDPTVNLTTNATVTAPFGGTASYAKVTDGLAVIGNTTTGSSFTLVQEDFGSSQTLSRYEVQDLYFTGGTSTWKLQYSTDGTSWTDGATFSVTANVQDFFGSLNVTARYVRLRATAFGTNGSGRVDSVIIYQDSFGADSSGNGNTWTLSNFGFYDGTGNDSLEDTPTNNWCTLNPLFNNGTEGPGTLAEGNLKHTADNNYAACPGTFSVRNGKYYWECQPTSIISDATILGIVRGTGAAENCYVGYDPNGNMFGFGYKSNGDVYGVAGVGSTNGTVLSAGQASFTTTDTIGFASDIPNGTLKFYKNNTLIYTVTGINDDDWLPAVSSYNGSVTHINFGQRAFKYTPPTGYEALNTANLPEPTIKDGTEYFASSLWTGNGTSQSITVADGQDNTWQPDLVWVKERSSTSSHWFTDVVRGSNLIFSPNQTTAEQTETDCITAFTSSGFNVGSDGAFNESSQTYVAWNWKAGGSVSADNNDDGSITSTVSANADAGFSIITYTGNATAGATIGHGLNDAPKWLIIKKRNGSDNWILWHGEPGTTTNPERYYFELQNTDTRKGPNTTFMLNGTAPTDSVITLYSDGAVNGSGSTYMCYAWAEVEGFSKFGHYRGTNNANGTFFYCGFRPSWVLIKNTGQTWGWVMLDAERNSYNVADDYLLANSSGSEVSDGSRAVDFLSNGFKLRGDSSFHNSSSYDMIFMAFAETPFKYANAR